MTPRWREYDCRRPRRSRGGRRAPAPRTLQEVLEPANLFRVMRRLLARNGQTPGVDGIRYRDLSRGEWFELLRHLRARVLAGTYRPQPLRAVVIKKADGGDRTLLLAVVLDRVLERAVAEFLTAAAESTFHSCSFGFRPGLGCLDLLAELAVVCETTNAWVITADDVKMAFDCVPVRLAAAALALLGGGPAYPDPDVTALAAVILRGHHQPAKEVGIAQGGALSPLTLNALLHFALDLLMTAVRGGRSPVWFARYADNILVVTRTAAEGRALLELMRRHLAEVGLSLKAAPGEPRDLLAGEHLDLLGHRLTHADGKLRLSIPNRKWDDLQTELVKAHRDANPTAAARQLVSGWVAAHAPALGTMTDREREETANRLVNLLRRTGHRDAYPRTEVTRQTTAAAARWAGTVNRARTRMTDEPDGEDHPSRNQPTAHTTAADRTGISPDRTEDTGTVATGTTAGPASGTEIRTTSDGDTRPGEATSPSPARATHPSHPAPVASPTGFNPSSSDSRCKLRSRSVAPVGVAGTS